MNFSHSEQWPSRCVFVNGCRRHETHDNVDPQEERAGAAPGGTPTQDAHPTSPHSPWEPRHPVRPGLGRAPHPPRVQRPCSRCSVRTVSSLQGWAGDGLGAARSPPSAASVAWRLAVASTRSPFRTGNRRAGREVAILLPEKAVSISGG